MSNEIQIKEGAKPPAAAPKAPRAKRPVAAAIQKWIEDDFSGFLKEIQQSKTLVPENIRHEKMLIIALLEFAENLNMGFFESLQNVAIIKGKITLYGDRLLAVCNASGLVQEVEETWEHDQEGNAVSATCRIKRTDRKVEVVRTFTMKEALKADLPRRNDNWRHYPKRMLQMRARGFAMRDSLPEVLQGIITKEEAEDMAIDVQTGQRVPLPPRERTVSADLDRVVSLAPEPGPQELTGTEKEEAAEEQSLGVVLRGIDQATTLGNLDEVAEVAKALPEHQAAKARHAFAEKRRLLGQRAQAGMSKAQRVLQERQARRPEPASEGPGQGAPTTEEYFHQQLQAMKDDKERSEMEETADLFAAEPARGSGPGKPPG